MDTPYPGGPPITTCCSTHTCQVEAHTAQPQRPNSPLPRLMPALQKHARRARSEQRPMAGLPPFDPVQRQCCSVSLQRIAPKASRPGANSPPRVGPSAPAACRAPTRLARAHTRAHTYKTESLNYLHARWHRTRGALPWRCCQLLLQCISRNPPLQAAALLSPCAAQTWIQSCRCLHSRWIFRRTRSTLFP